MNDNIINFTKRYKNNLLSHFCIQYWTKQRKRVDFMINDIEINFKVTPSQRETIAARVQENGFDEISAYLKVVALKTQTFLFVSAHSDSKEELSMELSFRVNEMQNRKIQENLKASPCETLDAYLLYVALHGVVSSIVEVRSTGDLDAMLERIAKSRNLKEGTQ